MIDPKELRIGNLVQRPKKLRNEVLDGGLIYYGINVIMLRDCEHYGKDWAFEPIPLNEKWFFRFGFTKHHADFGDKIIMFKKSKSGWIWMLYPKELGSAEENRSQPLKYVHQLQNLYYAITGKELKIKPDKK